MSSYRHSGTKIIRDLCAIVLSIAVAIWLERSGTIAILLTKLGGGAIIQSFVTGLFFTSAFTTAPAIAVFTNLTQTNSLPLTAFFGALGAVTGDLFLFRFVRDELSGDIVSLIGKPLMHQVRHIFKLRLFHWFSPFIAALIIASPLPDELAMAIFGLTGTRTATFIPI